jgi:uncharacterized heparinase superfamily protein
LALLSEQLGQFLPDGMHYERSPSYHAQVVSDLIEIRRALGEDPFGGRLDALIAGGVRVALDLAHPDGQPALFGDSGLNMAYPPAVLARAVGVEATPSASVALRSAGYYGIRDGGDVLMVDAGPLGPDELSGHAHGDLGAFEWSVGGERVVVDQGVFEYVAGRRRQASRSAANHNTVAAPDADQGDFFGAFRLGRRIRPLRTLAEVGEGRLRVSTGHGGFVGRRGGALHFRTIDATPHRIRVVDRLDRPLAGAAASLLLHPQARPTRLGDGKIQISGYGADIVLVSSGTVAIEPAEWWPDMGVAQPTHRLRMAFEGTSLNFELNEGISEAG